MNREKWLEEAIKALSKGVFGKHEVPNILVSVGFPSRRATSTKNRVIGECFNKVASDDKDTYHVFISPLIKDSVRVLDILAHEIIHTLLPLGTGHKAAFVKIMKEIGLVGKPTATEAGSELITNLDKIIKKLGEYPHIGLNASDLKLKKQKTRLQKVQCTVCECKVYTTLKWLESVGCPTCGCGGDMLWEMWEE